MVKKERKEEILKNSLPKFESEEQEADYWDTHSPLDFIVEPKIQKVRVRNIKDRPITIRLDTSSRLKLQKLSEKQGIGPSTLARNIIAKFIEENEQSPDKIQSNETNQIILNKVQNIGIIKNKTQDKPCTALYHVLESDWVRTIPFLRDLYSNANSSCLTCNKEERQMIWYCFQKMYVVPMVSEIEKAISEWDYSKASNLIDNLSNLSTITGDQSFDYPGLLPRILSVLKLSCSSAKGWRSEVYEKSNRILANLGVLNANIEDALLERDYNRIVDSRIKSKI